MSSQTEQPKPGDSPPAELNPLLNPLLAQNMNRWAQVYFNTVPEKRDQAVQELLHQLEAENAHGDTGNGTNGTKTAASSTNSPREELIIATPVPTPERKSERQALTVSRAEPVIVVCRECGRSNPSSQRFCGRCGGRLVIDGTEATQPPDAQYESELSDNVEAAPLEAEYYDDQPQDQSTYEEESDVARDHRGFGSSLNTNELSLFQTIQDTGYYTHQDDDEIFSTPSSGSFRVWIALVLLVILGGLGYMAWRSGMLRTSSSQESPLAPAPASDTAAKEPASSAPTPTATPAPSSAPTPSPEAKAEAPDKTPPAENPAPAAQPEASASAHGATPAEAKNVPAPPIRRASRQETVRPAPPSPTAGAEELATAESYLNGTNGRRNSAEGARWLWRAVAKHNASASFLLSELYLRGDGVSKNCEQARVLLDTAVLKGVKGAGERLRHMQAFGCQ